MVIKKTSEISEVFCFCYNILMENKKNSSSVFFDTFFRIIILIIVILFLVNIGRTIYKNHNIKTKIINLENINSDLENDRLNLKNRILFYETDIYKELEARKHLNYQKKDEKVVVLLKKEKNENITNENIQKNAEEVKNNENIVPNWQKWLKYIFG